ncbi:MAG TPA: nucleotidyltransferase family protein [Actinomycetaceae bacterium]|nr:nucleotidyltransferase family protein [Actinomycetaceae bacterium]
MPNSVLEQLAAAGNQSRELQQESRRVLIGAIRRAAAAGFSQREIARAVGLSQPEVSRLLKFTPRTARGRDLAARRRDVIDLAAAAGFTNVRVFGSVARGEDEESSDIDLLVTAPANVTLFDLARLERALSELLEAPVQLLPDSSLPPHLADRVLAEAGAL